MSLIIRTMEAKFQRELNDLEQRLRAQIHPGARGSISEEVNASRLNVKTFVNGLMTGSENLKQTADKIDASLLGDAGAPDERALQEAIANASVEQEQALRDSLGSNEQKNTDAPRADDQQAGQ